MDWLSDTLSSITIEEAAMDTGRDAELIRSRNREKSRRRKDLSIDDVSIYQKTEMSQIMRSADVSFSDREQKTSSVDQIRFQMFQLTLALLSAAVRRKGRYALTLDLPYSFNSGQRWVDHRINGSEGPQSAGS